MLGEKLGEAQAATVTRVLPTDGSSPRFETSVDGGGTLLGVPVLGPVLPRSSRNLLQSMVPGPKSTFWTHVPDYLGTFYHLKGGPISTFFYLGSLFGHLRMVKHTEVIGHTCPKSGPNPKVTVRAEGRT